MGFADSIKAYSKKAQRQVNDNTVRIAQELFTEIVLGTPVEKGVMINNWYVGTGTVYNGSYSPNSSNAQGIASLNQIASLRAFKGFTGRDTKVSLTNSTPYAFRAEYAGWPAPQWTGRVGPYAMIAKAFIKVTPKYKRMP